MRINQHQFYMAVFAVAVVVAGAASQALGANYNLIDLSPSGHDADAYGISSNGAQQVGRFAGSATGNKNHAILWNGSSSSYTDLHPSGLDYSEAYGTNGTQQVGYGRKAGLNDKYHALLWSGTAASCLDVHPTSGFSESYAYGTNGTQQIGWGRTTPAGTSHALLWNGSAEDYIDLHPIGVSGLVGSRAYGISDTQQVGKAASYMFDGPMGSAGWHAFLWNGSAGSYVDLHPSEFKQSEADGISGTQQVGCGYLDSSAIERHALLWSGTAASCLDLHPSEYAWSAALGTNSTQQVGWVSSWGGPKRPVLWNGSADDFVILPYDGFYEAWATGIDDYGNIVGIGSYEHALLWKPIPEPATFSLLAIGGLAMIRRRSK